MERLDVVAALLVQGDQIFLGQRKAQDSYGGMWEFPGGKVEANESWEQALVRELEEELGIQATVGSYVDTVQFESRGRLLQMKLYRVQQWTGSFAQHEHDAHIWTNLSEAQTLELTLGTKLLMSTVLKIGLD